VTGVCAGRACGSRDRALLFLAIRSVSGLNLVLTRRYANLKAIRYKYSK
jgi:hypothetical protein